MSQKILLRAGCRKYASMLSIFFGRNTAESSRISTHSTEFRVERMSFAIRLVSFIVLASLVILHECEGLNKYSAAANKPPIKKAKTEPIGVVPTSLRELDKPYRMAKLNLLWTKAKHRLTEVKLRSLFSDLKIHDKEELSHKHTKADGKDAEGLEEARLRKKLMGIMSTYGLLEHFAETDDKELLKRHKALNDGTNYVAEDVFDDRRLNKLWAKAERAGFTHEELEALKEEFTHHQDKVDEYKSLLKDVDAGDDERHKNSVDEDHESWNEIEQAEEQRNELPGKKKVDFVSKANLLREKHLEIKNGYDKLEGATAQGPDHKEFVEPKVQGLWRIAQKAKFSPDELTSLKEELHHYETRLLKLRHLHTEAALEAARKGKPYDFENSTDEHHIKKHARTVEKLHMHIEARILQKHTEL